MEAGAEFRVRIDSWDSLSRWERSELGKDLRRVGLSYGEVMDLIPVKKSTLATWCREVNLTTGQLQDIRIRRTPEPGMSLRGKPYTTQRPRRREIEMIRAQSFREAEHQYLPPNDGWRARLNLHAQNDEPAAREWWSGQVDIELEDFTKTYINPDGTGHRKNPLPYGVCTLTKRRSTDAYVITMAWIEFCKGITAIKIPAGR
jgi:hypothetical protein